LAGIEPDWNGVHRHERRSRVSLPTYPFERQRFWLTPSWRPREEQEGRAAKAAALADPLIHEVASSRRSAEPEGGDLETSRAHLGIEYVAPGNSTEQKIVEIWEELLGIHPIGIHDEFLRLGGNSLLAIRVAAELRESFQIEFPLEALLTSPTVLQIAAFVEDALLTMIEGMDESELSEMGEK
jgi:acyl carrier protein